MYELEGQLEPLEMQASIAKDYLFQQEELEKYEVTLLASEISSLTEKLAEVRKEFGENQNCFNQVARRITRRRSSYFT